jgi:hypothetical protein
MPSEVIQMSLTPESLCLQLGRLVADMPEFVGPGPVSAETNTWIGRAAALVDQIVDLAERIAFKVAAQNLSGPLHESNAQTIKAVVYGALARAEMMAPVSAQGAFVPAGAEFDAFIAFGKILQTATTDVLVVDPYADERALTNFAVQAAETVSIRILADGEYRKATLKPAAERWQVQYGPLRPLDVRLTPKKELHDRLIFVDEELVWTFGQSLNAIAARSHTSFVRVDPDTAALKVTAYRALWLAATPI